MLREVLRRRNDDRADPTLIVGIVATIENLLSEQPALRGPRVSQMYQYLEAALEQLVAAIEEAEQQS
jgi:tRNA A37 N6-isopentenylltransferase MiaA